ncbi:MAG: arginase family protein, partial [Bacteroidales bacterium]|nr:arginase family protein [Bacteroidales bacterium]
TGTPEPGGMTWYPTLKLLKKLSKQKKIVGFDIVELAPNPSDKSSDFLAAKLYFKILTYIFEEL